VQEVENEMRLSKLQLVAGATGLVFGTAASAYFMSGGPDASAETEVVALVEETSEEDQAPAGNEDTMAAEAEVGEPVLVAEVPRPPEVNASDTPDPPEMLGPDEREPGDPPLEEDEVGAAAASLNGTLAISLSGTCLLDQYSIEVGETRVRRRSATMELPVGAHEAVVSARVNMSSTSFRPTKRSRVVDFVIEPESESKVMVNLCKS
jgi:hypothetical protein